MKPNVSYAVTWPVDIYYGLRCFLFLAVVEFLLALAGKYAAVQSEPGVYAVTTAARSLDLFLLYFFLRRCGLGFSSLGLDRRLLKRGAVHALVWGAVAVAGGSLIYSRSILSIVQGDTFHFMLRPLSAFSLFTGVFFGPVIEELIFRGWLYGALRNRLGVVSSLLISSILFSLAHGLDMQRLILSFSGGVLFGTSYELSRSLVTPMVLHVGGNAVLNVFAPALPLAL